MGVIMPITNISSTEDPFADPFADSVSNSILLNETKSSLVGHEIVFNSQHTFNNQLNSLFNQVVFKPTFDISDNSDWNELRKAIVGTPVIAKIDNDSLILQAVDNSSIEELEHAEKEDLLGLIHQENGKTILKFSEKKIEVLQNSNVKAMTYQTEAATQLAGNETQPAGGGIQHINLQNVSFQALSQAETVLLIAIVKSQIAYLRALHTGEEKAEKTIKHLTIVLHNLEHKIDTIQTSEVLIVRVHHLTDDSEVLSLGQQILLLIQKSIEEKKEQEKEQELIEKHDWIIKQAIKKSEEQQQQKTEYYNKSDILAAEIIRGLTKEGVSNNYPHVFLKGVNQQAPAA